MSKQSHSFLEKTMTHLRDLWRDTTDLNGRHEHLELSPSLSDTDAATLCEWINHCLEERGGEVAARIRGATLGRSYLNLNETGQLRFLQILATQYDTDTQAVEAGITAWQQASPAHRPHAAQQLREILEPPRVRLLRLFNELPEGIKFLVDMRAQILALRNQYPELRPLETDLKHLLRSWFDVGLLQLEQIRWQSSAEVLEKLIEYEAVHAIQSWDDLKNRLDSDRRCFAFFHPNMPSEPLIFVEVALVNGLADNVQALLNEEAPVGNIEQADTAIFYSISNAQRGLAGISFGNFLIKRVVKELQHDFPQLRQFATLSPIPGFTRWLKQLPPDALSQLSCEETLVPYLESGTLPTGDELPPLKHALMQLAAHYLAVAKRQGRDTAADPVAHFHLSNGAEIAQLNWLADGSPNGLKQSIGMMVNYLYDLPHIEERSEIYSQQGTRTLSTRFKSLLNR